MAKLFLIIICVCTACVHLAWAQMAKRDLGHWDSESASKQTHRQGQFEPANVASDLEYRNQIDTIQNSNQIDDRHGNVEQKTVNENSKVHRMKRHAGHSTVNTENLVAMNRNTDAFIEKLFKEFTNGDRETMNLIQFETMMKTLKLDRFIDDNQLQQQQSQQSTKKTTDDIHHAPNSNETVSKHIFYFSIEIRFLLLFFFLSEIPHLVRFLFTC